MIHRKPWKRMMVWLLSIAMIATLLPIGVPGAMAVGESVQLVSTATSVNAGDYFEVSVEVNSVTGLYGGQIYVSFNPTVLEVDDNLPPVDGSDDNPGVQVNNGTGTIFNRNSLSNFTAANSVDNGLISYSASKLGTASPFTGNGILFKARFRAKIDGASTISFSSSPTNDTSALVDSSNSPILASFGEPITITVGQPSLASVELSGSEINLQVGQTGFDLSSLHVAGISNFDTAYDIAALTKTWIVGDDSVASVTGSILNPVSNGINGERQTTLRVQVGGITSYNSIPVVVSPETPHLAAIVLSGEDPGNLYVDKTGVCLNQLFTVTGKDQYNAAYSIPEEILWTSSNTGVASITSAHYLELNSAGTTQIRATVGAIQSDPITLAVAATPVVAPPTADHAQGTYYSQSIVVGLTADAHIVYALDQQSGQEVFEDYTGPITISGKGSHVLLAKAIDSELDGLASNVATFNYTLADFGPVSTSPAPSATLNYEPNVTLGSSSTNTAIKYRINGGPVQTFGTGATIPVRYLGSATGTTTIEAWLESTLEPGVSSTHQTFTYSFDRTYTTIRDAVEAITKLGSLSSAQLQFIVNKANQMATLSLFPDEAALLEQRGVYAVELQAVVSVLNEYLITNEAAFRQAAQADTFDFIYFMNFANAVKASIPEEIKSALAQRGIDQNVLLLTALDVLQSGLNFFALDSDTRNIINNILSGHGISAEDRAWLAGFGVNYDNLAYFLSRLTDAEKATLQSIAEAMSAQYVATPTASLASGSYFTAKKVQLSPATGGGVTTYYMLQQGQAAQGSLPTPGGTGWTQYNGGDINLPLGNIYRLVSYRARGTSNSIVISWTYSVEDIAPPSAAPAPGIYASELDVVLSTTTIQGIIYYTLDGTDPKTSATKLTYSGSIHVGLGNTGKKDIRAVTYKNGIYSPIVSYSYEVLATPVAVPGGGVQPVGKQVSLAARNNGAQIYYTTGAGQPDQLYVGPLTLDTSTTIRALVRKNGVSSAVATYSYTVEQKGSVTGFVRDDTGQGIPGIKIGLDGTAFGAVTLNNGSYTMLNVTVGQYTVRTYNTQGFTDETLPVEVANSVAATANFELSKGGTIIGKVEDSAPGEGDGLAGIKVTIGSANKTGAGYWGEAVTQVDGSFRIEYLESATDYVVQLSDPTGKYLSETEQNINITKGNTLNAGIYTMASVASQYATITGTVYNDENQAQANIHVSVWSWETGSYADATTDQNGNYTLAGLMPGNYYDLYIWAYGSNVVLKTPYNQVSGITLTAGQSISKDLVIQSGKTLTGSVYGVGDGNPAISGVDISLWSPSTGGWGWAKSQADGTFTIADLVPASDYQMYTYNNQFYMDLDGSLTVNVTSNVSDYQLGLSAGRSISGRVVDSGGNGIIGARVSVWNTQGSGWGSGTTDANGEFVIKGLRGADGYQVYVWKQGYRAKDITAIDLSEGNYSLTESIVLLGENEQVAGFFVGAGNGVRVLEATTAGGQTSIRIDYKNNHATLDAENPVFEVQLPAGLSYVAGSLPGSTYTASTRVLTVPIGNIARGASGAFTFRVLVAGDSSSTELPVGVKATIGPVGNRGEDSLGVATVNVIATDLQAPEAAKPGTIILSGKSSSNAAITLYQSKDGSAFTEIAKTKADGKWWSAKLNVPDVGTYNYYAVASVDKVNSKSSATKTVVVDAALPVLNSLTVKAGWNDWISTNPHAGIPALAASQGHTVYVEATFSGGTPLNPQMTFPELAPVTLVLNGVTGKYEGNFQIPFTAFGEQKVTLHYGAEGRGTFTLPFIELLILIDPSGIVYTTQPDGNTVPLQGVKAEVEYEKSPGVWVTWDAARYGQVNPQYTDENGKYGWDVPAGNYRVIFSMNGYETYVSETVVVPPPKTDLDPLMVNLDRLVMPAVVSMMPDIDASDVSVNQTVTVTFSKDMNQAAVQGNVVLKKGGTETIPASVTYNPNNRTVTLDPAADLEFATPYTVVVDTGAVDIWGNSIGATAWTASFTTIAPTTFGSIEARDAQGNLRQAFAGGNSPESVSLTGSLFLNGDRILGANKQVALAISKDNQQLWSQNVTTNGNGDFAVSNISTSGWTDGIYGVTGSYLASAFQPAQFEILTVAAPEASLSAGSYQGSQSVTLTTDTLNAEIYYTINGTTPTTSSNKYAGAVNVSQTTTLQARAYLRGVLSPVGGPWTYTISVTSGGGGIVTPVLTTVTVSGSIPSLPVGQTFDLSTLTVTGKDQNGNAISITGKTINWASSNSAVASVSGTTLTAVAAGSAQVTATVDGKTSSGLSVTVTAKTDTTVVDASNVDAQIAAGAAEVKVSAPMGAKQPAVDITGAVLQKLATSDKPLVAQLGDTTVKVAPGAITASSNDAVVTISATAVPDNQAAELAKKAGTGYKVSGKIMEIKAEEVTGNLTKQATVTGELQITLPYGEGDDPELIDIYWYNPATGLWEVQRPSIIDREKKTITVTVNHLSTWAVMELHKTFTDVQGHWAQAEVEYMASKNVVNGFVGNVFNPEANVTRAQYAAFLVRALNLKYDASMTNSFKDVGASMTLYQEIVTAASLGLVNGYSKDEFRPNEAISRQQMAVLVARALVKVAGVQALTAVQVNTILAPFKDSGDISPNLRSDVALAVQEGISNGMTKDRFAPAATATRAQAAVMLKRMLDNLAK